MATKEETFESFVELEHMLGTMRARRTERGGPMADQSRGRGRVLALLKMRDGVATRDMALVLGIRVSSLNETLARLEADGYVERRPSEEDGRVMLVYLTDSGRAAQQPEDELPGKLFAGFDDAELDALGGFLARMTASLERELGPDWREKTERRRNERERLFHEAGGHGRDRGGHGRGHGRGDRGHAERGPQGDREGHGHGHGGQRGGYGPGRAGGHGGRGGQGRSGGHGGHDGHGGPRSDKGPRDGGRGGYGRIDDRS